MRKSTPFLFLLVVFLLAGCDSANDSDPGPAIDKSIAQYPEGVVGKDIFYSTMWRYAHGMDPHYSGGIYSLNYDGTGNVLLYKDAILFSPPRDTQLVFTVGHSVYLGNTKGSSITHLFTTPADIVYAILSPDGEKVLYASMEFDDSLNIYDLKTRTSYPLITPGWDIVSGDYPVFSADSRKILFTREESGFTGQADLCIVNADGTGERVIVSDAHSEFLNSINDMQWESLALSADGTKCCYQRAGEKWLYELVLTDIATGVTVVLDTAVSPVWSPVSNSIKYDKYIKPQTLDSTTIYNVNTKQKRTIGVPGAGIDDFIGIYDWTADESKFVALYSTGSNSNTEQTLALVNTSTGVVEKQYGIGSIWTCYRARARGEH